MSRPFLHIFRSHKVIATCGHIIYLTTFSGYLILPPSPSPSYIYYDQTTLFNTPSPMHNLAQKRHILIESYFFAMGKGTSVGGVVFMSIIGAICFGLNTLPFLWKRAHYFNTLTTVKGIRNSCNFVPLWPTQHGISGSSSRTSKKKPHSSPFSGIFVPLDRCMLWSIAANHSHDEVGVSKFNKAFF